MAEQPKQTPRPAASAARPKAAPAGRPAQSQQQNAAAQGAAPNRTQAPQKGARTGAQRAPQQNAAAAPRKPAARTAPAAAQTPARTTPSGAAAQQGGAKAAPQPTATATKAAVQTTAGVAAQAKQQQRPAPKSAPKNTPGASGPAAVKNRAAAPAAQANTAAKADAAQRAPAPQKPKPQKRTAEQGEKGRVTRNTVPLHSTAILQLEQIARSMQRGVNDAALVQADTATRLPLRLLINALGQVLYRVGLQAEYGLLRIGRALSHALHLFLAGVILLLRTFLRPIGVLLAGIGRDLSEPVVHLFVGIGHMFGAMRAASKRGENALAAGISYAKAGFHSYRRLGAIALSYLLPAAAAAILAITVWSVLDTPFSLAVTYNDKLIGYVESEAVWEDARKKVADRIRASSPDETFDARPQFNVVAVQTAARRDASDMANIIIAESPDEIQNATGVYVDDTLMGVCSDGAAVQALLDTTLVAAKPADDPTARVEFVNSITTDTGLYFTDSITTLTQLESTLQSGNWLQVKMIRTEVADEIIAFETVEEESNLVNKGSTRVKQRGVDGKKTVTYDVAYIGGVEIERTVLAEEIHKDAVPKLVLIGTRELGQSGAYTGPITPGSGTLAWPVPGYKYTTTEFGYHRGLDICAAYGTPVYASDRGTVVEAGWHGSWGNYVLISHGNGLTTRYAHNSRLLVSAGQTVEQGTQIAEVGNSGFSFGNHCHFEVEVNGSPVNPRNYVTQP